MTTTTKLFDLGSLSEAAYTDFTGFNSSFRRCIIEQPLLTESSL